MNSQKIVKFIIVISSAVLVVLVSILGVNVYSTMAQDKTIIENSQSPTYQLINSELWAGYVATSNYTIPQPIATSVEGNWKIPTVNTSRPDTFSLIWVGIGGNFEHNDGTLLQIGSSQFVLANGSVDNFLWYQTIPDRMQGFSGIKPVAGDEIHAEITQVSEIENLWNLTITDLTTNQTITVTTTYQSSQLSAEWIIERPILYADNLATTLADFSEVTFTDCKATFGNQSGVMTNYPLYKYRMVDFNGSFVPPELVKVSELINGDSFTGNRIND